MTLTLSLTLAMFVFAAAANAGVPLTSRIAEAQVALWQCQDKLPQARTRPSVEPWALPRSQAYRKWVLKTWSRRHADCLAVLHERARQYNWQAWLPDHGRRLAICESGLRWDRGVMHSTDGTFVSAFAISLREYDRNAALMGVRPWFVKGKGDPNPWEQWQAAIGHYKRFGDGWTGHCHGIMR